METGHEIHPQINPHADVRKLRCDDDAGMTTTDYLIDATLVLLVLLQVKERTLTTRTLIRPLVIVGIAVASYLHGFPTAGNDLPLVGVFALTGALIGLASGQTVRMRRGARGEVLARTGWASGFFWVLGMGSRFAFVFWITHMGAARSPTSVRRTRSRARRRGQSRCWRWPSSRSAAARW